METKQYLTIYAEFDRLNVANKRNICLWFQQKQAIRSPNFAALQNVFWVPYLKSCTVKYVFTRKSTQLDLPLPGFKFLKTIAAAQTDDNIQMLGLRIPKSRSREGMKSRAIILGCF